MMFYIVSHMDWVDSKELVHKFGFMGLGSYLIILRLNSPGPLTDDWKVTDDSSVNFMTSFFFFFC